MEVFVTTYKKYNAGSSVGFWLDLSHYEDKECFLKACLAEHSDEEEPELMFSDSLEIPSALISESSISEDCWDILDNFSDQLEEVTVFIEWQGSWDSEAFQDSYIGQYDSAAGYAQEYIEETGDLDALPENLRYYFDYEKFARDLQLGGDIYFDEATGHTFSCH